MRNETRTYRYLKELYPDAQIVRQYKIEAKIEHKGKVIRNFIKPDFYLNVDGKEWLIEYNGKQHYELTGKTGRRYGGRKGLAERQCRDQWLREYCVREGINLLEIDGRKYTKEKIRTRLKRGIK